MAANTGELRDSRRARRTTARCRSSFTAIDRPGWRRLRDGAFSLDSLISAIISAVAVGNVLRGLPIETGGPLDVPFVTLLAPYATLIGVLTFNSTSDFTPDSAFSPVDLRSP